jgi:DNA-binding PadR family transcriptional regulator
MHRHDHHDTSRHERFDRHQDFADLFGRGRGPVRGPHGRGRGPRGGRARRGDVRAAILALLSERPMYGYEIIQELEDRTDGIWRPSPGSIYPTLQLLDEQGLVVADETSGKKRYELTDEGRAQAEASSGPQKPWDEVTEGVDPNFRQMRDSIVGIIRAMKQVFEEGTTAQKVEVVGIMAETRRRLYSVLARDEDE